MKHYLHKNRDMIDATLILLVIGALCGIGLTSKMNLETLSQYSSALVSTLVMPEDIGQFFCTQCLSNLLWCILIFFLGFSVLGIPFIQFFVFLKGFQIGFSCALFLIAYDIKGILGIVMTLVPQVLFDTLAIGVVSIASLQLSGHLIAKINDAKQSVRFMKVVNRKLNALLVSMFLVLVSSFVKSTAGLALIELFCALE